MAAAAIRARDEHQVIELGRPQGASWFPLADLSGEGVVARELQWVAGAPAGVRPADVAASYLAGYIGSCVLAPAATLLVLEGLLPDVSPGNLWLHREGTERWYDRIAYAGPSFWCAAEHAAAGHPDARPVGTTAELVERLASTSVEQLTPVFQAIRARAPYGLRGMWGSLADEVASSLLWITRRDDGDATEQRRVWKSIEAILDVLTARAPQLRVRPSPVEVDWSAGSTIYCRRGTCCLFYKTPEAAAYPEADQYCSSCPLRDPDEQLASWRQSLESPTGSGS
jgi:hypothetical protein